MAPLSLLFGNTPKEQLGQNTSAIGTSRRCATVGFQTIAATRRGRGDATTIPSVTGCRMALAK
jgi:hypothetical protein